MDLALSEEQEMLWKSARDFLANKCPKTMVREMEEDEKGYAPDVWKEMAGLGWTGLIFPEKYGGSDGTFLDLAVLVSEMGRACLPSPFIPTVVLGGLPILEWGTDEQKQNYLSKICKGEIIMTLAVSEPSVRFDLSNIKVTATPEGDNYVISGTKLFVPFASEADCVIVAAKAPEGITLFLIDAESGLRTGVPNSIQKLKTIAGDNQCELTLDKVKVPKANILGQAGKGLDMLNKIVEWAALAKSAEMSGGAQYVMEMSLTYAKERVAFGVPIGSFQIIQHYLVDMSVDVDSIQWAVYHAAWTLGEGLPTTTRSASTVKAYTNEAYQRVCYKSHMIHAAIGFTKDHDLELYTRRAKAGELFFGDADFHLEVVAQQLGL